MQMKCNYHALVAPSVMQRDDNQNRGKTKKNRVSDEDLFSVLTSSELHHSDAQMADPAWQVRDRSRSF